MNHAKQFLIILVAVLTSLLPLPACADDWDFVVAPYAQLPWISGDASIGRVEGADVDVSAGDILDYFSLGGMVQVEAHHKSGIGFVLNYAFMNLEDSLEGPKGYTDFDGELFQGMLEGFVSYRFEADSTVVDLYTGARWWDMELDVSAENALGRLDVSKDADWVDPVVGARLIPTIGEQLKLYTQADVGGFSVSSESSVRLMGGILYSLSESTTLALLYQAMWVDYRKGDPETPGRFVYDTVTHGPLLGAVLKF